MRRGSAAWVAIFVALSACQVARPGLSADQRLQRVARAYEAYALGTFYEESRQFLRDHPSDPRAERVRWDLALQLVTENLLSPTSEEAAEARQHLNVLVTRGSSEAIRFDASLLLLKFAPKAERQKRADELRRRFTDHPELVQVDIFAVSSALEELDIVTAGRMAKVLLDRFPSVDDQQFYRDVIQRAALLEAPLPIDTSTRDRFPSVFAARVLLIDFWASWCEPCAAELPRLRAYFERQRAQGFEMLSVNLDERAEVAEEVLRREPLLWPNIWSPRGQGTLSDRCGISDLPAYLIVVNGRVRATELRGDGLYTFIDQLLAEALRRDPSAK